MYSTAQNNRIYHAKSAYLFEILSNGSYRRTSTQSSNTDDL